MQNLNNNKVSPIVFPKAQMNGEDLIFNSEDDYRFAMSEGVFYVKIPDNFKVEDVYKFCQSFYQDTNDKNDKTRGFKELEYNDSILGYSDRPDQVEQLQLEVNLWDKYFPNDVSKLLHQMNKFGIEILKSVFDKLGVIKSDIPTITGDMESNKGLQYIILNHYRSFKNDIGIATHKDSGFITVLYMLEEGLEAKINGEYISIPPEEGYFTINLGHALEVLSENLSVPVKAVDHRVTRIMKNSSEPDRHTYGTYIGPRFDMDLYQYDNNRKLKFYQKFVDFQKIKARKMGYEFHPKVKIV